MYLLTCSTMVRRNTNQIGRSVESFWQAWSIRKFSNRPITIELEWLVPISIESGSFAGPYS